MNFGFTEEQDLLRNEVRKLLAKRCPLSEVRRVGEEQAGFCANLWSEIGELGSIPYADPRGGQLLLDYVWTTLPPITVVAT